MRDRGSNFEEGLQLAGGRAGESGRGRRTDADGRRGVAHSQAVTAGRSGGADSGAAAGAQRGRKEGRKGREEGRKGGTKEGRKEESRFYCSRRHHRRNSQVRSSLNTHAQASASAGERGYCAFP